MKRFATALAVVVLSVSMVAGGGHSATAAKPPVTIDTIANKTVARGKAVIVKPSVKTRGSDVKVTSKTLTATAKGVNLKNKSSVTLKAGTYKLTQTVKYQVREAKTVTLGQYDVFFADCRIVKVITDEVVEARMSIACSSDDFPGTQAFTVDMEWVYCDANAYLDHLCSWDEFVDGATFWMGQSTNGAFTIESFSDDWITPKPGEKFRAIGQVLAKPLKLTGTAWSKTKTTSKTQTLKITTRK